MAETQQAEEVQQSTFDVMSEALDDLHRDDPVAEDVPVEALEERVDAEPESEVVAESDVKTPTYQEAQDAQQDTGSGGNIAEEPEEELQASEGLQEASDLNAEDAEVYESLKPKAQERFQHWIDRAKSVEAEYQSLMQGNNQIADIIQTSTTNPQQLGWALEMFKGLNSGDYTTAVNSLKALDKFSDQVAKTLGVQSTTNEKSSFNDFEDLSNAVENLEMSEEWASKLASQRVSENSVNQARNNFQEYQNQYQQQSHQIEVQKNTAFQNIEHWEQDLTEKDPDYSLKKDIMIEMGTKLANSDVPPDQWLPVLQNQYNMISRGMTVAGTSNGQASKRSRPLAPGVGNSGTVNAAELTQAEVTPEFLQAHLDAMHE